MDLPVEYFTIVMLNRQLLAIGWSNCQASSYYLLVQSSDHFLGVDQLLNHGSIQLSSGSPPRQQSDCGGRGDQYWVDIDKAEIASVDLYRMSHNFMSWYDDMSWHEVNFWKYNLTSALPHYILQVL